MYDTRRVLECYPKGNGLLMNLYYIYEMNKSSIDDGKWDPWHPFPLNNV